MYWNNKFKLLSSTTLPAVLCIGLRLRLPAMLNMHNLSLTIYVLTLTALHIYTEYETHYNTSHLHISQAWVLRRRVPTCNKFNENFLTVRIDILVYLCIDRLWYFVQRKSIHLNINHCDYNCSFVLELWIFCLYQSTVHDKQVVCQMECNLDLDKSARIVLQSMKYQMFKFYSVSKISDWNYVQMLSFKQNIYILCAL